MPTLSTFCGILIQMFRNDRAPPAVPFDIRTPDVLEGRSPAPDLAPGTI